MGFKLGQDIIDLIRGKKIVKPCSFDFKSMVNTQIYTGDNEENSALHEAYKNHKGNVSIKWEQYLSIYNRIFQKYINLGLPIKTLEIGIMNGGFLEILKRILPKGSEVSGIDINPECKNIEFTEDVNLMIGNLLDRTFYEQNLKNKKYDIIIDDASHICKNTIETFEQMFQNLEYGGVFVKVFRVEIGRLKIGFICGVVPFKDVRPIVHKVVFGAADFNIELGNAVYPSFALVNSAVKFQHVVAAVVVNA